MNPLLMAASTKRANPTLVICTADNTKAKTFAKKTKRRTFRMQSRTELSNFKVEF